MGHHCLLSGFPTGKYCSVGDVHPDDVDQDLKLVFNFTQMPSNRRSLGTVGNCHSFFSKAFVEKLRGELLVGNYYSFCGAPHLLTFSAKLCRKEVPQFEVKGEHPCPDSQLSDS